MFYTARAHLTGKALPTSQVSRGGERRVRFSPHPGLTQLWNRLNEPPNSNRSLRYATYAASQPVNGHGGGGGYPPSATVVSGRTVTGIAGKPKSSDGAYCDWQPVSGHGGGGGYPPSATRGVTDNAEAGTAFCDWQPVIGQGGGGGYPPSAK